MSESKLPQAEREARGLVGIKTPRIRVATYRSGTPLTPGSSKWQLLERQAIDNGVGDIFHMMHGKLSDRRNFFSSMRNTSNEG